MDLDLDLNFEQSDLQNSIRSTLLTFHIFSAVSFPEPGQPRESVDEHHVRVREGVPNEVLPPRVRWNAGKLVGPYEGDAHGEDRLARQ